MTQQIRPTSKALIAYPTMLEADYVWIENLKKSHKDPEFNTNPDIHRPHFVIHRKESLETNLFIEKVEEKIQNFHAFEFTIRQAVIMRDILPSYKLVLVPMEGLQYFMQLQSLIYINVLGNKNFPFSHPTPYIHIAWSQHPYEAKARIKQINQLNREIKGRIEKLSIKEWQRDNNTVPTIHEFTLKSP